MPTANLPVLRHTSSSAWHSLFDLAEKVPGNWCLVDGQMAVLWCTKRSTTALNE